MANTEKYRKTVGGYKILADRAICDENGRSLAIHLDKDGQIDSIGGKYITGTGEEPVDAYTKEETDALLTGKADVETVEQHVNATNNPHHVTKEQVGLGNVGNFKAVSTEASQGLASTEKKNARGNIDAMENVVASGDSVFMNLDGVNLWVRASKGTYDVPMETVTIGGRAYPVVQIGNQIWMAENLAMPVGTINTDYRTVIEDGVELYFYKALSITNGNEIMSEMLSSKLPEGWRIPTQSDFSKLATTVGNNSNSLKSTISFTESTLGWLPHQSTNPTNDTGFNLKSITRFNSGEISFSGTSSVLLSSTKSGSWYFYYCTMSNSYTAIDVNIYAGGGIAEAYPVRLVKDVT